MIPRSLKPWSDDPNVHANFPISLLSTVTKKALKAKKGTQHLFEIGQTAAQKNISRLNQQFRPKKKEKLIEKKSWRHAIRPMLVFAERELAEYWLDWLQSFSAD